MKIVIDIDECIYELFSTNKDVHALDMLKVCTAVRKGIPLQEVPEIDDVLDEILRDIFYKQYDHLGCGNCGEDISFGLTLAAQIIYNYKNRK